MFFHNTATKFLVSLLYITGAHALSDECKAENEEINATSAIQTEVEAVNNATASFIPPTSAIEILKEEWKDPLPDGCFLKDGNLTMVCVFDYGPYVGSLEEACEADNRTVFTDEFKVVCQTESDRRSELNYLNYTMCVGESCDADNVTDAFEGSLEDEIDRIDEEGGVNCLLLHTVNHDLYDSGSQSIKPLLLSGSVFVLSFFLFV